MKPEQVWVFAEHAALSGKVAVSRYRDFDEEPDSDDYLALDAETAREWLMEDGYKYRAAYNALEYLGLLPEECDDDE